MGDTLKCMCMVNSPEGNGLFILPIEVTAAAVYLLLQHDSGAVERVRLDEKLLDDLPATYPAEKMLRDPLPMAGIPANAVRFAPAIGTPPPTKQ
jgi:hypothetical protein